MVVTMLDKTNWDIIEKESPNSFKKFMDYIDDFKTSCNWSELFNGGLDKFKWLDPDYHSKGGVSTLSKAPKFHEIPFAMQKGIIQDFLLSENISFYPLAIEGTNPVKWSFHTVDLISGKILTKTIDLYSSILIEYNFSEEAEVAAIGVAFQMLNESYIKNLN